MITLDELDRDPWTSYPVDKAELRKLIEYRDLMQRYDGIDPNGIQVHHICDNPDGSADVEFSVGRKAAKQLIKEGLLSLLLKAVEREEAQCKSP